MSWLDLTSLARLTMALPRWLDILLVEVILPKVCIPNPIAACAVQLLVRRSRVVGWIFYIGGVAAYVIDGFVLKIWFVRSELAEEEG